LADNSTFTVARVPPFSTPPRTCSSNSRQRASAPVFHDVLSGERVEPGDRRGVVARCVPRSRHADPTGVVRGQIDDQPIEDAHVDMNPNASAKPPNLYSRCSLSSSSAQPGSLFSRAFTSSSLSLGTSMRLPYAWSMPRSRGTTAMPRSAGERAGLVRPPMRHNAQTATKWRPIAPEKPPRSPTPLSRPRACGGQTLEILGPSNCSVL
jgi:hypothetical protein